MSPFLLFEVGTLPAWGLARWLDAWNILDLASYCIQVRLVAQLALSRASLQGCG